jgi:hypothetical protein
VGAYARKHNPWVNSTNVPSASNRPLTDFPTDYATLPAVSMVVPNLNNDMHDGTIAQGDAWVRDHLDGYVQWAKTHNSLFILTFDEDDNQGLSATALHDLTVSQPDSSIIASDDFDRLLANGWGSADVGGPWTSGSSASYFAVSGGAGSIAMKAAGSGPGIALNAVSSSDVDLSLTMVTDKAATGGGTYLSVAPRRVAGAGQYRAKVHLLAGGSVRVALTFVSTANVETAMVGEATSRG